MGRRRLDGDYGKGPSQRLQVSVTDETMERLAREAKATGQPIPVLVRMRIEAPAPKPQARKKKRASA